MPPIKMKLKTLSPVHIGSGNKIEPFEYFTPDTKYYRMNLDKCFEFVFSENEGALDQFNRWIEEKAYQMGEGNNKAKSSYSFDIFSFISDQLHDNFLLQTLKDKIVKDPAFRRYSLDNHYQLNGRQVAEIIKTANNELYIPGSSIKGMLRNVLMNYTIRNMDDKNIIRRKIQQGGNNPKFFAKDIEDYIFNYGPSNRNQADAKYDMMKFIQVSDTNTISCEEGGRIANPQLYKNNGEVQPQVPYIEAINEEVDLHFILRIDTEYIREIQKSNKNKDWIKFDDKLKLLLGINSKEIMNNNNNYIEKKVYEHIDSAIADFSAGIIMKESYWAGLNKKHLKSASNLFKFYKNLPQNATKLGWASGFPGITIFDSLTMDENNIERDIKQRYVSSLRKFKIIQNKNVDEFPLSHRFETSSNTKINPIGWVSIEKE